MKTEVADTKQNMKAGSFWVTRPQKPVCLHERNANVNFKNLNKHKMEKSIYNILSVVHHVFDFVKKNMKRL